MNPSHQHRQRPGSWPTRARERITDAVAVLLTAGVLPLLLPTAPPAAGYAHTAGAPAAGAPTPEREQEVTGAREGHPTVRPAGRLGLQLDPDGGPPIFAPEQALLPPGETAVAGS